MHTHMYLTTATTTPLFKLSQTNNSFNFYFHAHTSKAPETLIISHSLLSSRTCAYTPYLSSSSLSPQNICLLIQSSSYFSIYEESRATICLFTALLRRSLPPAAVSLCKNRNARVGDSDERLDKCTSRGSHYKTSKYVAYQIKSMFFLVRQVQKYFKAMMGFEPFNNE